MSTTIPGDARALSADRKANFVILTSQRTGSTLLVRSLDGSSRILCAGELYRNSRGIHRPEFRYPHELLGSVGLGRLCDLLAPRHRIRNHLTSFYLAAGVQVEAIGFKLMLSELRQYPAIMPTALELRVRCLVLYRDNIVATALSYCRAKATGVFHSDKATGAPRQQSIVVSESEFERILRKCKSDKEELIRLHATCGGFLMRYEDMAANWDEFIEKLGAELGVAGLRVSEALTKLRSGVDSARIANEEFLLEKFGVAGHSEAPAESRP